MNRRTFLKSSASFVAGSAFWPQGVGLASAQRAAPARSPNILLILADDLGYAELGVQGCKDIPTPNIDSIATNGVRFTDGHVSCPICAPTRAGLMTGRYQQRYGFETNPGPEQIAAANFGLDLKEVTLATRLKSLGYATGMFGKWHIGYKPDLQPTARGFDEFFGFLSGANNYLPGLRDNRRNPLLRGTEPIHETEYLTDAFGREAVSFIQRHKDHPWFVYLSFNAVHSPLEATEAYKARFLGIKDEKRQTYAAMTAAMDDAVGRVLAKLREMKLEEDTLIFFLSDNGGPTAQTTSRNDPLRGFKGQMWEGGHRVPFLAQWKGRLPAGRASNQLVSSLDIHPTAVVAAGVAVSPDWKLDGVNLLPYLTGEKPGSPHETLCWRMGRNKHAIRHGEWKLVMEHDLTKLALFNLAEDLGEANDLADKRPDKLKELTDLYQSWDAQMEKPRWEWGENAPEGQRGRAAQRARRAMGGQEQGQALDDRFKHLDRNGDGKLTPDELPQADLFKRLDKNGDGIVTPEEARDAFRGRGKQGRE